MQNNSVHRYFDIFRVIYRRDVKKKNNNCQLLLRKQPLSIDFCQFQLSQSIDRCANFSPREYVCLGCENSNCANLSPSEKQYCGNLNTLKVSHKLWALLLLTKRAFDFTVNNSSLFSILQVLQSNALFCGSAFSIFSTVFISSIQVQIEDRGKYSYKTKITTSYFNPCF